MSLSAQPTDSRQHFRKEDDARALNMVLRMGTIYQVDFESVPPLARIESGELITDLVPFPNEIGNNFRRWRPLRVGSQVLFACPSGDSRQAVIVCTYNTVGLPQPDTDEATDLVLFDDGTELRKDGSQLLIDSAVPITIKAPKITLQGPVQIDGASVTHNASDIGDTHFHLIIVPSSGAPVTPPVPL